MLGRDLDIMDASEDEHVRTAPYLHSSPGWITQQKAHAFLYGCPHAERQVQAYQALRTPTVAQSLLVLILTRVPVESRMLGHSLPIEM